MLFVYNVVQPADCFVCRIGGGELVEAAVNAKDSVQNPLANSTPGHPINDTLEAMIVVGVAK